MSIDYSNSSNMRALLDQLDTKIEQDLSKPALDILSLRLLALARLNARATETRAETPEVTVATVSQSQPKSWLSRIRNRGAKVG